MQYVFQNPIPLPWLLADIATVILTLWVVVFIIRKSDHPAVSLLEGFCFVFLYAGVFENFAVVQGWYVYGRSLLMIGDVPLTVPLIEMDVLLLALWMLEKMQFPIWARPFVVGLLGMLQDFSLDPVATSQVFTTQAGTTSRWTWLTSAEAVNIHGIPVYNFPGWMLIMLYGSALLLIGRWWFKRSGYRPAVGYIYPFATILLALVAMVSPLSQFLLWLGPFFAKGGNAEWVMLAFHLAFPTLLLVLLRRGRSEAGPSLRDDLPVFAVPALFHLLDISFALAGGYTVVLPLVVVSSLIHISLLGLIFFRSAQKRVLVPA